MDVHVFQMSGLVGPYPRKEITIWPVCRDEDYGEFRKEEDEWREMREDPNDTWPRIRVEPRCSEHPKKKRIEEKKNDGGGQREVGSK
jgi:hypothetical protein